MEGTAASIPAGITPDQRERYYAAAVAGLRELDRRERTPRRFGADAETRWSSFRGSLNDADRLEFLIRDASITWGPAFSPAEIFGAFGLAPDEPFGPDWQPISGPTAKRLLTAVSSVTDPLDLASLLGIRPRPVSVPSLSASTRLAVGGGGALVSVAQAFAGAPGLSWSDQVLAVATEPATRQLAGLLAIVVGSSGRTRLTRPGDDVRATLRDAGFTQLDASVVSPDAEPACAAFAARASGVA